MENELVAAILANPSDNGARLVYGDWLLSRGDPRGELVVAQCRLAEGTSDVATEKKLRAAAKKLEKALAPVWVEEVREALGYPSSYLVDLSLRVDVERGFVVGVQAPADVLLRLEALFAAAPFVTELRIGSIPPFDEPTRLDARYFASPLLSRLESLVVGVPGSGDALVQMIARCPHLASLKKLSMRGARWAESLGLRGDPFTVAGASALAASPHLHGLTELCLDDDTLPDAAIETIVYGPWKLASLSVAGNPTSGRSFEHIARAAALAGLKRLNVRGTIAPRPEQAAMLASSSHLASLLALDIERCMLGPRGLAAFLEALRLPALEELIAASNDFGEEGAELIAKSTKLSSLRVLDVTKNKFNKRGIVALAQGPGLAGVGKVLLNERDSADARSALATSPTLAQTKVYFRGKLIAKEGRVGRKNAK